MHVDSFVRNGFLFVLTACLSGMLGWKSELLSRHFNTSRTTDAATRCMYSQTSLHFDLTKKDKHGIALQAL